MTDLQQLFDRAVQAGRRRGQIPGSVGKPDGNGGGVVRVAGRADFVHVLLGSDGQMGVGIARAGGVPYQYGYPVLLERYAGELVIIGPDWTRLDAFQGDDVGGAYAVPYHTHRKKSGLEYEIEALLLEPGRVKHSSGMTVAVNGFRYRKSDGTWETYEGGTLDLSARKPATVGHHAWVVVGVNPATNAAVAATGTSVSTATDLAIANIDGVLNSGYIPLCAIDVHQDDTTLNQIDRYHDARGWLNIGGGSVSDPLSIGEVRAQSASGLALADDSGTRGVSVADGGFVGIGDASAPTHDLHVENTGNNTSLRVSDGTTDFYLQVGSNLGSRIILDDNRSASDKRWDISTGITTGALVLRNNDDAVDLLTLLSSGLGILTDAPQGPLHIHDGTAGLLFVSKTGITGTAQTLIPNGAGDITVGVIGWHMTAAGGTPSAGTLGPLGLSSTQNVTIGANTYQYAVSAGGALTVQRTAGTAAGSCALLLLWL